MKFSIYLNRHVFVMSPKYKDIRVCLDPIYTITLYSWKPSFISFSFITLPSLKQEPLIIIDYHLQCIISITIIVFFFQMIWEIILFNDHRHHHNYSHFKWTTPSKKVFLSMDKMHRFRFTPLTQDIRAFVLPWYILYMIYSVSGLQRPWSNFTCAS